MQRYIFQQNFYRIVFIGSLLIILGQILSYLSPSAYADSTVLHIQQRLKDLGYAPGPLDGVFGGKTETAIERFQQEQELAISSHNTVLHIQQRLKDLGYNPGPLDGVLGEQTETAIERFQQEQELDGEQLETRINGETTSSPTIPQVLYVEPNRTLVAHYNREIVTLVEEAVKHLSGLGSLFYPYLDEAETNGELIEETYHATASALRDAERHVKTIEVPACDSCQELHHAVVELIQYETQFAKILGENIAMYIQAHTPATPKDIEHVGPTVYTLFQQRKSIFENVKIKQKAMIDSVRKNIDDTYDANFSDSNAIPEKTVIPTSVSTSLPHPSPSLSLTPTSSMPRVQKAVYDSAYAWVKIATEAVFFVNHEAQRLPSLQKALTVARKMGRTATIQRMTDRVNETELNIQDGIERYVSSLQELETLPEDIMNSVFQEYTGFLKRRGANSIQLNGTLVVKTHLEELYRTRHVSLEKWQDDIEKL